MYGLIHCFCDSMKFEFDVLREEERERSKEKEKERKRGRKGEQFFIDYRLIDLNRGSLI